MDEELLPTNTVVVSFQCLIDCQELLAGHAVVPFALVQQLAVESNHLEFISSSDFTWDSSLPRPLLLASVYEQIVSCGESKNRSCCWKGFN